MTTLNLDADNVETVTLSVETARALLDLDLGEDLTGALDNAQALVFGGDQKTAYVVIKIVP